VPNSTASSGDNLTILPLTRSALLLTRCVALQLSSKVQLESRCFDHSRVAKIPILSSRIKSLRSITVAMIFPRNFLLKPSFRALFNYP
jgi:hypothetical protein